MSHRGTFFRTVAALLVVALPFVFVPTVSAAEVASLSGTLFAGDGTEPIDGAIVHAADLRTGKIYSAPASTDDGTFELSDLPAAAYELAVERDGGLYTVGAPVQLAPGQTRSVQVAINAQAAPDPGSVAKGAAKKGFWNNPLLATLTVIGSAIVVGALISEADDSDEGLASPFQN